MIVYTDGACSGSPGIGGWAWVSPDGRKAWGSDPSTTNNRMELLAVLDVVQHVQNEPLIIHSDSAYVVNCFTQGWWKGWLRTNFKNDTVSNRDLWEPLIYGVRKHSGQVKFVKVKGHSGDKMNDLADKFAVTAKKKQLPTTRQRTVARRRNA